MAEMAVGLAIDRLVRFLTHEQKLLRGVHSKVSGIKNELEAIQCFLKDADMKADLEAQGSEASGRAGGVRLWVKELREVAFHIEDIIDEYADHLERHPGRTGHDCFIASLGKVGRSIIKLKAHHHIASRIKEIQKAVVEIKERSERYGFDSIDSTYDCRYVSGYDPRKGSMYLEDDDVVGIESPRDELVGWLLNKDQQPRRAVISVVGMGGLGKTTLARKVYDRVRNHFDCHAWITVSQSYRKEELLKNVIKQFCKGNKEPAPEGIDSMDEDALTEQVREYLQQKRYVVFYDDVWKKEFWGDIQHVLLDKKIGGRIVITTRSKEVGEFCKISSVVYVHELKPLNPEKARELFFKKAFQSEVVGLCPPDLEDLSHKIVERCGGLPLAIVAVGGLLSTKDKTIYEWKKLHDGLSSELESNLHLTSITKILSLSYYDLPYYLKCCFLYFGMYPEDYWIAPTRLIPKWIAEGFVKPRKDKPPQEVGEEYLTELIDRSLVQKLKTSDWTPNAIYCHVHDLLYDVIQTKMKDLSFGHVLSENESSFSGGLVTRRISIVNGSCNVLHNVNQSFQVRSFLNFNSSDKILTKSIWRTLTKNFNLLKVLDFENSILDYIHDDIGSLYHLRYLNINNTKVKMLPRSIGKLVNLETLDSGGSFVVEIPAEIKRLTKLLFLFGCGQYEYNLDDPHFHPSQVKGIKVHEGIGCLEALQSLAFVDASETGVEVLKEFGKLTQLRYLGIQKLRSEDGRILLGAIEKMAHLKYLHVSTMDEDDASFDSEWLSSLPRSLEILCLTAPIRKLPESITRLQYLERFEIGGSKLEEDPVKSLKNLHNLVEMRIVYDAYNGEEMQFEKGVFPRLKELRIMHLSGLKSIVIEEGALSNLQALWIGLCPKLLKVPIGIRHLKQLESLLFHSIPIEFQQSLKPGGDHHHTVQHVPLVLIRYKCDDDDGESFETSRLF
nr:disease resistance protein RPM1-like [Ziziphus jujuba var. spinosa]